jgi:hypothetical protein
MTTVASDALESVTEARNVLLAIQAKARVSTVVDQHAVALATELGLAVQAKRYETRANDIKEQFAQYRHTAHEIAVWRKFCPTQYVMGSDTFANYAFDTIPVEVLEHWAKLKREYAWDSLEIRTTERTRNSDPLLIGTFGGEQYLLARWGNEAPDLISFDQVRERVCAAMRDFDITSLPAKVADVIRNIQHQSLERIFSHGTPGFFAKKHCGERMYNFADGSGHREGGNLHICTQCGTQKRHFPSYYD